MDGFIIAAVFGSIWHWLSLEHPVDLRESQVWTTLAFSNFTAHTLRLAVTQFEGRALDTFPD